MDPPTLVYSRRRGFLLSGPSLPNSAPSLSKELLFPCAGFYLLLILPLRVLTPQDFPSHDLVLVNVFFFYCEGGSQHVVYDKRTVPPVLITPPSAKR